MVLVKGLDPCSFYESIDVIRVDLSCPSKDRSKKTLLVNLSIRPCFVENEKRQEQKKRMRDRNKMKRIKSRRRSRQINYDGHSMALPGTRGGIAYIRWSLDHFLPLLLHLLFILLTIDELRRIK